jgi:hypothetical protein
MDKQRAAAIEAVAARDEQIKTHSVEYLWVCHGVKPPLLPNTPVVTESKSIGLQLQLRLLDLIASTNTATNPGLKLENTYGER